MPLSYGKRHVQPGTKSIINFKNGQETLISSEEVILQEMMGFQSPLGIICYKFNDKKKKSLPTPARNIFNSRPTQNFFTCGCCRESPEQAGKKAIRHSLQTVWGWGGGERPRLLSVFQCFLSAVSLEVMLANQWGRFPLLLCLVSNAMAPAFCALSD